MCLLERYSGRNPFAGERVVCGTEAPDDIYVKGCHFIETFVAGIAYEVGQVSQPVRYRVAVLAHQRGR